MCKRKEKRGFWLFVNFLSVLLSFWFFEAFCWKWQNRGNGCWKIIENRPGGWNSLSEWVKFIVFYPLGQCFLIAFTTLFDSFHVVKAMLLQRNMIAFTIQEKCLYWLSISYRLRNFARFSIYFTVAGFYRGDFKVAKIKV